MALTEAQALLKLWAESLEEGFLAFFRPLRTIQAIGIGKAHTARARTMDSAGEWPPEDGREFIRSDAFGELLVSVTIRLATHYPKMDFSDAVAMVFVWFDGKLSENRRFINSRRFPTYSAFNAYLRQAVWNAARLTMRQRRQLEAIESGPIDEAIPSTELGPEERVRLIEMVDGLTEPHKTVFYRYFFEEEDLAMIASILNLPEGKVHQVYEEAVDILGRVMA